MKITLPQRQLLRDVRNHPGRVVWHPRKNVLYGTLETQATLGAVERRALIDYEPQDPTDNWGPQKVVLTDAGREALREAEQT